VIVVKVGGSLFDHPRLGPGLRAYLDSLAPSEVLLVPGGGRMADAVRELDRIHGLGEELSHWVAVRAMDVMGEVLRASCRVGRASLRARPTFALSDAAGSAMVGLEDSTHPTKSDDGPDRLDCSRVTFLNCLAFLKTDDSRPGALPHSWAVTSDSIAARAAIVFGAERLVLLKSVDVPAGTSWEEAAARGWVDPHFSRVVAGAAFASELVNIRRELDSLQFSDDQLGRIRN